MYIWAFVRQEIPRSLNPKGPHFQAAAQVSVSMCRRGPLLAWMAGAQKTAGTWPFVLMLSTCPLSGHPGWGMNISCAGSPSICEHPVLFTPLTLRAPQGSGSG